MNVYYAILDWIHLLATVTWIGGIIFYTLVLMPATSALDPPQRGKLMGAISKKYAPMSGVAILLLILTGILINIERGIPVISLSTTYGIFFFIKHLCVLVMICIGVVIALVLGPKLKPPASGDQPAGSPPPPSPQVIKLQKTMGLLGTINMVLGIVVLLLTALARA
ncbi:MAG: DUF4149 domain-containing protein [Spirochaetales bacterium]|jgi:copper resistance protein D|nr:DUF4149 domain-containing protein [Spirochaetales bacterium]